MYRNHVQTAAITAVLIALLHAQTADSALMTGDSGPDGVTHPTVTINVQLYGTQDGSAPTQTTPHVPEARGAVSAG
jgi:hypothetical protein